MIQDRDSFFLLAEFCLVCSQTRTAHPAGHRSNLLSIFQIILIATVWKIELCLREKEKKSYRLSCWARFVVPLPVFPFFVYPFFPAQLGEWFVTKVRAAELPDTLS